MSDPLPDVPDSVALVRSLASEKCPTCGRYKRPRMTLCGQCYGALPVDLRNRLYARVGSGYEEAIGDAMKSLGVAALQIDPAPKQEG